MIALASLIVGYLIGGLPTGIILCRVIKGVDPRAIGSKSSGATNVSRVLGKKWAAVVLIIDGLKGFLPVRFLAPLFAFADGYTLAAALMAIGTVAGHVWTPYAGLRGGKGVAAAAGSMLALGPLAVLLSLGVWAVVFVAFRIVSLASMAATAAFPVALAVLGGRPSFHIAAAVVVALIVLFSHRGNLSRLFRGEEKTLF
ncbi:glycerol-3-phosphate 1-O-acyltransferase PlsY [bacterium]|nr:glycerol-3-phosphate 1-O-acyltransferase PlsY [bacterium]MBU1983438.1 glycerol-3-phosphate 1-O-acyltransferase PlsY [bacterium]